MSDCEKCHALKAENERLKQPAATCDSCGDDRFSIGRNADDFRCRGCGKTVCQTCADVFHHVGNEEHGLGDPVERIAALEQHVTHLTADAADNRTSVTVHIPRENVFTAERLRSLMLEASIGGHLFR